MQIPLLGSSARGSTWAIGRRRLVNAYSVALQGGGVAIYGVPGMAEWLDLGTGAGMRGFVVMDGDLYAVSGDHVFRISTDKAVTPMIGSLLTASGGVSLAENRSQVCVTDGAAGYICDGSAVARITAEGFPGPGPVAYQDQYFIIPRPGDRTFQVSGLGDGTAWDALDVASAEKDTDNIQTIVPSHGELLILKEYMAEVWYDSGGADFPYARRNGAEIEVGCLAPRSVARADNTVWWLGRNREGEGKVFRLNGYQPAVVSTRELEQVLAGYSRLDDAEAFAYQMDGQAAYVLSFPTADATWVYDVSAGLWHERKSAGMGRWRPSCHAFFAGRHLVGDSASGKIYALDQDAYDEAGQPIEFIFQTQVFFDPQGARNVFHRELQVALETGRGLPDGREPVCALSWSDDMGQTWSNERFMGMGRVGEYAKRSIERKLGVSRARIYRLRITDPVRRVLSAMFLDVQGGQS